MILYNPKLHKLRGLDGSKEMEGYIKIVPTINDGGSEGNATVFEYLDKDGKPLISKLSEYTFSKK